LLNALVGACTGGEAVRKANAVCAKTFCNATNQPFAPTFAAGFPRTASHIRNYVAQQHDECGFAPQVRE
jgi:hypothetical protein